MLYLLFSNTISFALEIFSSFTFFSAGLLYFDSWQLKKKNKNLLVRSIGFFILAFVYSSYAASLENPLVVFTAQTTKIIALALILTSLFKEPIIHLKQAAIIPILPIISNSLTPISAILFFLISLSYFRRSTEGLDKQLKGASVAFFFLALAEIIKISFAWQNTQIVYWSQLLAKFKLVWNIYEILSFIGIIMLAFWLWGYIRFRFQIQLFVSTIALSLVIFLSITSFFTFLLLKNLQDDALSHLATDTNVLEYSLDTLKSQTLAISRGISKDSSLQKAIEDQDKISLSNIASSYQSKENTSTLIFASTNGSVLMRAENKDLTNDSVLENPIFKDAAAGKEISTIYYSEGITEPTISVLSATPIQNENSNIIGVVITGFKIDNTFVDGVKSITGLDTTIFGKDKRAATTFLAPDGKSLLTGTIETNKNIIDKVLSSGQSYIGTSTILSEPFYVSYKPLKSSDGSTIGMIFTGKPQNTLSQSTKKSINLTFLGSTILIILSLIPTYFFSKFLSEHIEA